MLMYVFFIGHSQISCTLVKVYHLAFTHVLEKGGILIILIFLYKIYVQWGLR
jgi:hypothetical protein